MTIDQRHQVETVAAASTAQAWALCEQGRELIESGHQAEGMVCFEQAASLAPDNGYIQINPWTHRHYLTGHNRQDLRVGFRDWAERFLPRSLAEDAHENDPHAERCLRVGFISPDFCRSSVAITFEPVLEGWQGCDVEVFGYGNVKCPDEVTERLRQQFHAYRSIYGQSAKTIVQQIRADRIDILVSLAGHVTGNALEIMALKPAPVQADMGGLSTTGLVQIDYRITDACYDPPVVQSTYVEQCVYLPGGLTVFKPPLNSPPVGSLPLLKNGKVTFGAFNNSNKISPEVLAQWIQLLRALPEARLLMKFPRGDQAAVVGDFQHRFQQQGISPERLDIVGYQPYDSYLQLFQRVDLLLDTYPYNGGITTLEGLWMGVPTVSWTGEHFVSRAGFSILSQVGLEIFCASDAESYVQKALAFTRQPSELAQIRDGLRGRLLASPLCHPQRMAQELEGVFRSMWRRWCGLVTDDRLPERSGSWS